VVEEWTTILGYAHNEEALQQTGLQYVLDKHTNTDKHMIYNNRLNAFVSVVLYC